VLSKSGLLFILAFLPGISWALCSTPTAGAGAREFFSATDEYKFCDGTNWVAFPVVGALAACSNLGRIEWDATEAAYKVCNGFNYIELGTTTCSIGNPTYQNKVTHATNLLTAMILRLSADGTKAIVSGQTSQRIAIYDISSAPAAPSLIGVSGAITQINDTADMEIHGNYAFVASRGNASLTSVNISNPASPTYTSAVSAASSQMTNIWGVDITSDGDYAVTVSWQSGAGSQCYLHVVDITNPASMSVVGTLDLSTAFGGALGVFCDKVKIRGNTAFVSFNGGGIASVDITNKSAPSYISHLVLGNGTNVGRMDLTQDGNTMIAVTTASYVHAIDVTDPSNMTSHTNAQDTGKYNGARGVTIVGDYAFVAASTSDTVTVLNITNPSAFTQAGFLTDATNLNGAWSVAVKNRYAFVATRTDNGLAVIDLGCDPISVEPSGGSCSVAGRLDYNSTNKAFYWCDGTVNRVLSRSTAMATVGTGTTWTVPAGVTKLSRVEVWGGGGGSGGKTGGYSIGGGGGGAYARIDNLYVEPGQVIDINIGAGGISQANANGGVGGDTWFLSNITVMAKGGSGSNFSTYVGGAGGHASASIGSTKYSGGTGGSAASSFGGGGAGSAASTTGNGANGTNGSGNNGMVGGTSPGAGAGGGGGAGGTSPVGGTIGTSNTFGGGGGGGGGANTSAGGGPGAAGGGGGTPGGGAGGPGANINSSVNSATSANGAPGQIIITY